MRRPATTLRRRRLARHLRQYREQSGLSLAAAGHGLGWSAAKLCRIEICEVGVAIDDLSKMLDFYGVDRATRAALMTMGREAERRSWWTAFSGRLPGGYVELEAEAGAVRAYEPVLVFGLLQTPDYVRAVVQSNWPEVVPAEETDRRVAFRMARQSLLTRPDPIRLSVVLDEAVLHHRSADQT